MPNEEFMVRTRVLFPLMATVGAVVLALLTSEFAARLLGIPARGVHTVTSEEYERLPGIYSPGQRLVVRDKPALPYELEIDSLGYRGVDFPRLKPSGEFRVFMAGDSFTFGDYVDDEETLPSVLQRRLRSLCRDEQISVINAGLGGSTIVGQKQLIRRGLILSPDLVILTFSENDIDDVRAGPLYPRLQRNREVKSRFPISLVYTFGRNTALWHLGLKVHAKLRARGGATREARVVDETLQVAPEDERRPTSRRRTGVSLARGEYTQELRTLERLLSNNGIELQFVLFPSHHSIAGPTEDLTWVEQMALGSGLAVYNLRQGLADSEHAVTELYLLPEDGHPSPLGYDLAARHLAEELITGVLKGRCDEAAASDGVAEAK